MAQTITVGTVAQFYAEWRAEIERPGSALWWMRKIEAELNRPRRIN